MTSYRALVYLLQYLSQTIPDLTYSINQVARFVQEPRTSHLVAAKRILRYVEGTLGHGLVFQGTITTSKSMDFTMMTMLVIYTP